MMKMSFPLIERHDVLGVEVSAINQRIAVATIEAWINCGERHYVCVTGVHGVMESRQDSALREIHNAAGLVTPDGMPLVWLLKAAGYRDADRVYGPDLMLACFAHSQTAGWRHFLYGSSPEVLSALEANMLSRFPQAQIVGSFSPPFRPLSEKEEAEVQRLIEASGADIVWVGLSTPKQEQWMAAFRNRLSVPVMIGVGAAFDFHSGRVRQAPHWIQRSGLEWAFRLSMEPRRLWRRYLRNVPLFIVLIAAQKLGLIK